jgi:hypothetical protein
VIPAHERAVRGAKGAVGNAERCIAHLKQVEEAGIEEVILYFNVGLYPHVETMVMMERFAREVMPAFAGT